LDYPKFDEKAFNKFYSRVYIPFMMWFPVYVIFSIFNHWWMTLWSCGFWIIYAILEI
jgi:hypothetical protein